MATAAPPAPSGPAHVAVVSFLAARAAPTGGFWIALAGGVALARVAERRGVRLGYGASVAAMLETVAIIGPARFGIPLTQAVTAPLLGRLDARRVGVPLQVLVCALLRLLHNTATTAFFIWVIAGGLDAYAGTYDALARRVGLEVGSAEALVLTAAGLIVWAVFASVVQVLVYRRGLAGWEAIEAARRAPADAAAGRPAADAQPAHRGRFDPRFVALAAAVSFGLLLAGTAWLLLASVAAWLALAWWLSRPDPEPLPTGLVFAGVLAGGALLFSLGGGLGLEVALQRAARAALLVLSATWLRAAAGADGLREVSRRALGRLRRVPSADEAAHVLDGIAAEGRLAAAARSLGEQVGSADRRPIPFLDAVLGWVVHEAAAFRELPLRPERLRLRARASDVMLAASAALPAAALVLGGG